MGAADLSTGWTPFLSPT